MPFFRKRRFKENRSQALLTCKEDEHIISNMLETLLNMPGKENEFEVRSEFQFQVHFPCGVTRLAYMTSGSLSSSSK